MKNSYFLFFSVYNLFLFVFDFFAHDVYYQKVGILKKNWLTFIILA